MINTINSLINGMGQPIKYSIEQTPIKRKKTKNKFIKIDYIEPKKL